MRMRILAVLAFIIFAATGCVPSPRLTNRYSSIVYKDLDTGKVYTFGMRAKVRAFSMRVPDSPPPAKEPPLLLSLDGRAQAAVVRALDDHPGEAGKLKASLDTLAGRQSPGKKSASSIGDRLTFGRRLVFSIEKESPAPADRIAWAKITVRLAGATARKDASCQTDETKPVKPENKVKFVGWERVTTQEEDLEVGTLKLEQKNEVNAQVQGGAPQGAPFTASASLSGTFVRTLNEDVKLSERRQKLTPIVSDDKVSLIMQGGIGTDLTGSTTFDVKLRVDPRVGGAEVITSVAQAGNGVEILREQVYYPDKREDVLATVDMEYWVRHVVDGDSTKVEYDDTVEYLHGRVETGKCSEFVVVPAEELRFLVWRIATGVARPDNYLGYSDRRMRPVLEFASYDAAESFLELLRKGKANDLARALNSPSLLLGAHRLSAAEIPGLNVFVVDKNQPVGQGT